MISIGLSVLYFDIDISPSLAKAVFKEVKLFFIGHLIEGINTVWYFGLFNAD
jgi:hypothetical protein